MLEDMYESYKTGEVCCEEVEALVRSDEDDRIRNEDISTLDV